MQAVLAALVSVNSYEFSQLSPMSPQLHLPPIPRVFLSSKGRGLMETSQLELCAEIC